MARKNKSSQPKSPYDYVAIFPRMENIMNIEVNMDSVVVNGVTLQRPSHISRSAWMAFWDKAARIPA